jgi:hypothetical protein
VNTTDSADIALAFGMVAGQPYAAPDSCSLFLSLPFGADLSDEVKSWLYQRMRPKEPGAANFRYCSVCRLVKRPHCSIRTLCCRPSGYSTDSKRVLCAVYDAVSGFETNSVIIFT